MTTGNDKDNEPSTSSNCNNTERKEINNLTSPSPPPLQVWQRDEGRPTSGSPDLRIPGFEGAADPPLKQEDETQAESEATEAVEERGRSFFLCFFHLWEPEKGFSL